MFNLESSITNWRQQMLAAGIKSPVPLDELEIHLREDVEQQVRSGLDEQQAFETAGQRIGRARKLESEFAKTDGARQMAVWLLLTAIAFAGCWLQFGRSPALALVYGIFIAGLAAAALIDFRHFIIPDKITLGGVCVGLVCSALLPQLQGQKLVAIGALHSLLGVGLGAALMYVVLRAGKLAFGRQRLSFPGGTKIIFTDTALLLPDKEMAYAELFYRPSDTITLHAHTIELAGRTYQDVPVLLSPAGLQVGDDKFDPRTVPHMEAVSSEIVIPREAMGLGDVKFMSAIGAFLGWPAVVFSLIASSLIGALVGVGLVAVRRREWSARLPYGPYIALAAVIWIFGGRQFVEAMFAQ
ncbi:MAG TPA: prepilin peptidase [Candidatus Acidoferrales bacterium]|jgi:leader peptidase (prepilin peptidase)/N-methyltransferase|nr:prepilin peptidase [Candidatus Acidoferrales bacterium]